MPTLDALLPLAWIPFVTAFIGWLTNWVAIRMLFRPRRPLRILGLNCQGLVPRRQADVAETVAEVIEREVLNQHTIRGELERLDLTGRMDEFVRRMIREKAGRKLQAIPLVGAFINDRTVGMIERAAVEAVHEESDKMRDSLADDLEQHLQIRAIVRQRIAEFDLDKLESVVKQVASRELRLIEWLGAILGFGIGCAQVAILVFFH